MLPAPLKTGKWGMRSVTSSKATKWLNAILAKAREVADRVTSHSLKCTALSWLAKARKWRASIGVGTPQLWPWVS